MNLAPTSAADRRPKMTNTGEAILPGVPSRIAAPCFLLCALSAYDVVAVPNLERAQQDRTN